MFSSTEFCFWFIDHVNPDSLRRILNEDFTNMKNTYTNCLSRLIDDVYGIGIGDDINFPSSLTAQTSKFNADKIVNGALPEIGSTHENILLLISFGAGMAVDLTKQIADISALIEQWKSLDNAFFDIDSMPVDIQGENARQLQVDFKSQLEKLRLNEDAQNEDSQIV